MSLGLKEHPRRALVLRIVGILTMLGVIAAVLFVPVDTFARLLPHGSLAETNAAFIQSGKSAAIADLLVLAELDALVSVVQTIEIGVSLGLSAQVEVGQALASLSSGLDRAMLAATAGIALYEILDIALKLATVAEPYLLQLVLLLGAIHALVLLTRMTAQTKNASRAGFEIVLILFLILRLGLPYGVGAASALAGLTQEAVLGDTRSAVSEMHNRIVESNAWNGKLDSLADESLAREVFGRAAADFPRPVETLGTYSARRIVVSLFEGIVVPAFIILMFVLIWRRISQNFTTRISR